MTREEILNTPELVDFMLDESVIADSREKLRKRLEKVCNLAIKALEQEPCESAISRQAVLEYIEGSEAELGHSSENELVCRDIKEFPPVTPQPKTGHWISYWDEEARCYVYKCPECGNKQPFDTRYCWECGTRLDVSDINDGKYSEIPKGSDSQGNEKINCKSTKCEKCINHNYCDFEPQKREG